MNYSFLATWKMSHQGICLAQRMAQDERHALSSMLCAAVRDVEDNPSFHSVGYGAYPNRDGDVQTDAAYMDGTTTLFGAIAGARDIKNPIDVAYALSHDRLNCFLCGDGATAYARRNGFPLANLLTEEMRKAHAAHKAPPDDNALTAYAGHDTVCVLGQLGQDMAVATSTSGLSMKRPGRVGDTPIPGAGFYCDSRIGAAAATGIGEDIMRGCLSYEIVRCMERGMDPGAACRSALRMHMERMKTAGFSSVDNISIIALSKTGDMGAATTLPVFAFVYASQEQPAAVWVARKDMDCGISKADTDALQAYTGD